jgi:hypothetical protein
LGPIQRFSIERKAQVQSVKETAVAVPYTPQYIESVPYTRRPPRISSPPPPNPSPRTTVQTRASLTSSEDWQEQETSLHGWPRARPAEAAPPSLLASLDGDIWETDGAGEGGKDEQEEIFAGGEDGVRALPSSR